MIRPYEKKTYYALTLDPIHVGTGGYRLGRVDNTITREPGTNLPKIPGTSISGVVREYTAIAIQDGISVKINSDFTINYEDYKKCKYLRPAYQFIMENDDVKIANGKAWIKVDNNKNPFFEGDNPLEEKYYSCAGKGIDEGEGHCGEPDCPVCVAYGFSKGKSGSSFQGLAQFFDIRILFFPVYSMLGPVWITSPSILNDFKEAAKEQSNISITLNLKLYESSEKIQTELVDTGKSLNLGWILLENKEKSSVLMGTIPNINSEILKRLVLVQDNLFTRIVNDNLEVRTSVAIDPATGAAEEGALYTYEAIPRSTVMWFDVIFNKPEYFRIKVPKSESGIEEKQIIHGKTEDQGWTWIRENVEKGLLLTEYMGVGGMNTRGMGRMRILNLERNESGEGGAK